MRGLPCGAAVRLGDFFGFLADAFDPAAEFPAFVEQADAVVAEVDDDKIAGFAGVEDLLPAAFGVKRARHASTKASAGRCGASFTRTGCFSGVARGKLGAWNDRLVH